MKKTKTDSKNDSFFEMANFSENQDLELVTDYKTSETDEVTSSSLLNLIRQLFLFLPGALLLYLISFIGIIILIDSFSVREPLEMFGISSPPVQLFVFAVITLLGIFMTWFGLGDIRNKKHFSIPTSIMMTGGILALISKILGDVFGFTGLFEVMNYYFIYLFPLVLIVPILVKGWIDSKEGHNETK